MKPLPKNGEGLHEFRKISNCIVLVNVVLDTSPLKRRRFMLSDIDIAHQRTRDETSGVFWLQHLESKQTIHGWSCSHED